MAAGGRVCEGAAAVAADCGREEGLVASVVRCDGAEALANALALLERQERRLAGDAVAAAADGGDSSGDGEAEPPPASLPAAALLVGGHRALLPFASGGRQHLVYRVALPGDGGGGVEELRALPTSPARWAFFFLRGGHFAAAVFQRGAARRTPRTHGRALTIAAGQLTGTHKCLSRYVVRAKRGTTQSAHDAKSGAAKSAGANLRRANEVALAEDIRALLRAWGPELATCTAIFVQAPLASARVLYGGKPADGCLDKADVRIRKVPFATGRPTLKEVVRAAGKLAAVYEPAAEPKPAARAPPAAAAPVRTQPGEQPSRAEPLAVEPPDAGYVDAPLYAAAASGDVATVRGLLLAPEPGMVNYAWNDAGETALHAASRADSAECIAALLAAGADPTTRNERGLPPYAVAGSKAARDAFRRGMAAAPDAWEWVKLAQVPSPLTDEMVQRQLERAKAEKKKARERQKARERERSARAAQAAEAEAIEARAQAEAKAEAARLARMTPRERAAAAALERYKSKTGADPVAGGEVCAHCAGPIAPGDDRKFSRYDFVYCQMRCLQAHKAELGR